MTTLDSSRDGAAVAAQTGVEPQSMDDLAPAAGPSGHMQANSRRRGRPAMKPRLSRDADQTDDELRTLHLVRRSRRAAGGLTIGIATVSFVLSFTSLRELAAMAAWPGWPSWLWPLIIDGTIVGRRWELCHWRRIGISSGTGFSCGVSLAPRLW